MGHIRRPAAMRQRRLRLPPSSAGAGRATKETVKEKAGQGMTVTTEPTWAVVWVCAVDRGDNEPSVSLHASLADTLAKLRKDYDPDNEFADVRNSEFLLLVEIDHDLCIDVHPSRINTAQLQRVDLDGWNKLRDLEKYIGNE
jgi:hypothetical protein